MSTVLIVDDERDIVNALNIYLKEDGYDLCSAYNGNEALALMKDRKIDLVLLDIMMPEMDGLTVLQKLRGFSNIPVILLTAKSEEEDIVAGLNAGADDYITKPFVPSEVKARVASHLRRYTKFGGQRKDSDSLLGIGGITMDDTKKRVTVDDREVALTPMEYGILKLFLENPGTVFSSKDIYRQVWNESPIGSEDTVAVHIRHLREKIEINPSEPRYITVVWGRGYRMEEKL